MDDLISRQAAIDALDKQCDILCPYSKKQRNVMCGACALGTAFDVIEALPSAQPEIVRCKDCKHYKEWESEFTPNAVVTQCMADNFPIHKAIPDGWFCAGAERRTDERFNTKTGCN